MIVFISHHDIICLFGRDLHFDPEFVQTLEGDNTAEKRFVELGYGRCVYRGGDIGDPNGSEPCLLSFLSSILSAGSSYSAVSSLAGKYKDPFGSCGAHVTSGYRSPDPVGVLASSIGSSSAVTSCDVGFVRVNSIVTSLPAMRLGTCFTRTYGIW